MKNLNTPININKNLKLKNRIVIPPMASATSDENGFPTAKTYKHYEELAQTGAALVMVEYTYVHSSGKGEPNQLGIYSDEHIIKLKTIADIIKSKDAVSAIQLVHCGAKSSFNLTKGKLIGPSSIPVPNRDNQFEVPIEATSEDIKDIKKSYVEAAIRSTRAGFNIIELHAAHGYGLNQWLSPLTNQRIDNYGGNLRKRANMLFEIVGEILHREPNMTISVRMPGQDYLSGGLTQDDMLWLAKELELRGVKIINISSGLGGWRRPNNKVGEGYLVDEASFIQKQITIPVIGVGGIETKNYINLALKNNWIELAAVGRAILNNKNWVKEILTN